MMYRKLPVTIEAFRLGMAAYPEWFVRAIANDKVKVYNPGTDGIKAKIKTPDGIHKAGFGDYIIKGIKGELYPCKPEMFAMTYELVKK